MGERTIYSVTDDVVCEVTVFPDGRKDARAYTKEQLERMKENSNKRDNEIQELLDKC